MHSAGGDVAIPTTRTAGQVARVLGVAESTLRAWHRRYGVGPHAERPGGYRRYTDEDVARLQRMHDLVRKGMLPSDAARAVERGGVPVRVTDLLAAAADLDSARCRALLGQALGGRGVVDLWETLCRPALTAVDEAARVDREHVLSWAITATLHRVGTPGPVRGGAALLACTDTEQHSLPLEALAAALAERGVPARMLGAAVPTDVLVGAVSTTRPDVVVLWSHQPGTARQDALAALAGPRPPRVFTAGPGWPAGDPAGHLATLPDAVALLAP